MGQEIQSAIQAGKEVTFHERGINAHGFSGYGYIITDPDTGGGAYLIEGKGNGGWLIALGYVLMVLFAVAGIVALILPLIVIGGAVGTIALGLIAVATLYFSFCYADGMSTPYKGDIQNVLWSLLWNVILGPFNLSGWPAVLAGVGTSAIQNHACLF